MAGKIPHPDNAFKTFNISYCLCGRPKELSLNTSIIAKLDLLWMQISVRWKMVLDRTLTPGIFSVFSLKYHLNSPLFERLKWTIFPGNLIKTFFIMKRMNTNVNVNKILGHNLNSDKTVLLQKAAN